MKTNLFVLSVLTTLAFIGMDLRLHADEGGDIFIPSYIEPNTYTRMYDRIQQIHEKHKDIPLSRQDAGSCRASYDRLFSRDQLNISLFYGYGEISDTKTSDITERLYFESSLLQTCRPGIFLCDFKAIPGHEGIYYKDQKIQNGSTVRIRIQIFHSSLTMDGEYNIEEGKEAQRRKSQELEDRFIQSLGTEDIVFYNGHARLGSGVGLRPLPFLSRDWFQAYFLTPMLYRMKARLEKSKTPAKVLGMFMCDAEIHVGSVFSEAAPDSSYLLTRQTTTSVDNMRSFYVSLNNLLGEKCEPEFQEQLNATHGTIYYMTKDGPPKDVQSKFPKLFNFFKAEKIPAFKRPWYLIETEVSDWEWLDFEDNPYLPPLR